MAAKRGEPPPVCILPGPSRHFTAALGGKMLEVLLGRRRRHRPRDPLRRAQSRQGGQASPAVVLRRPVAYHKPRLARSLVTGVIAPSAISCGLLTGRDRIHSTPPQSCNLRWRNRIWLTEALLLTTQYVNTRLHCYPPRMYRESRKVSPATPAECPVKPEPRNPLLKMHDCRYSPKGVE